MSDPRGQVSDCSTGPSRLNQASTSSESAESFSDASSYFEAWLAELKPAIKSHEDLPSTKIMLDNAPATGEFRFEGTLRLDGCVKGLVHSLTGTLILSRDAELESDIVVASAVIDGCLRGDVRATERVELLSHALVLGNIDSPAIVIQPGAVFEGECRFLRSPDKSDSADSDSEESRVMELVSVSPGFSHVPDESSAIIETV
jgi:cytoskeletal protein CcmA (bactofilin family)